MATTNVNLAALENQFTNACYADAAVCRADLTACGEQRIGRQQQYLA
jgi:hypothetical protein